MRIAVYTEDGEEVTHINITSIDGTFEGRLDIYHKGDPIPVTYHSEEWFDFRIQEDSNK